MKTSHFTNFRDLGGIKTKEGKIVKLGRLLRSSQPVNLQENEITMLKAHNLKHIIDFRTTREVEKDPIQPISGAKYSHIDIMGKNNAQAADPHVWMKMLSQDIETVELQFIETYKNFATSEASREGYGEFLRACADLEEGAVLFHCAAGKDRTGLGAAIILRLLGASDDDIYTDYLKTIEFQEQIAAQHIQKVSGKQLEALKVLMGVKKEYLSAALSAATEQYSSFESYIKEGLGISQYDIERIQNLYLEP